MKNFIMKAFVIASVTSVISCTNDNDPLPIVPTGGLVPKTIERSYSQGWPTSTVTYTYDGNKIKEININPQVDVSKGKFTYTGDNITKLEVFSGPNFTPYTVSTFEYANDKLSKVTSIYNSNTTVRNYTYNTDGTVTEVTTGAYNSNKKYTLSSGNIAKTEYLDNNGNVVSTDTATFDAKNNIHKNITGLSKIFNLEGLFWDLIQADANNRLTYNQGTMNTTYTYEYNSEGYPTKRVETKGTNTTTSVITY
ncbi:hypothetical protein EIZ47_01935 [Chryseobacterium lacus]|uniref:DUF4595 domain-containing protein n=1 Tax=Chryseobacterium lacus TaxID=2058346 RepID=A0A368N359_9FLAO|nr:hypothetical protein [Chryseobacterium lacus]RCU44997.1 hypothetical protein DQ356_01960 [Chryseobacterium lacus]RST32670.1 hypothetical protein EIZ47_01935 [Chryseobacterium lacus]